MVLFLVWYLCFSVVDIINESKWGDFGVSMWAFFFQRIFIVVVCPKCIILQYVEDQTYNDNTASRMAWCEETTAFQNISIFIWYAYHILWYISFILTYTNIITNIYICSILTYHFFCFIPYTIISTVYLLHFYRCVFSPRKKWNKCLYGCDSHWFPAGFGSVPTVSRGDQPNVASGDGDSHLGGSHRRIPMK